jgi:hypothetical protein
MTMKFTFHEAIAPSDHDQKMSVVLGVTSIKAYVTAPKEYKVIGIVKFGFEFGLLAMTPNGNYLRVNGSEIESLFKRDVQEAIHRAKHDGRGESFMASRAAELAPASRPAPAVMLKRHRRIDPELAANNSQLQPLAA